MTSTGTVTDIKLTLNGSLDLVQVTLLDSHSGQTEVFVLWGATVGTLTPFSEWIARSLAMSIVRDALVNKLTVTIYHDDTSSLIQQLHLQAA